MPKITQEKITKYVEEHLPAFHRNRIKRLQELNLTKILKRKNPYLFKVKNITTANEFITTTLDAHLSSQEESMFGGFLEELAIFVCGEVFNGQKSTATGIDLEFNRDGAKYIVSIKSGPNWGNSSQIAKLKDNFRLAKRILGTNVASSPNVIAINGCCYGKDNNPDKGDYRKECGQQFWSLISNNDNLYTEIIGPLGHKAKEKNDQFYEEYGKVVNKFSSEFIDLFCDSEGLIHWEKVIKFNSGKT